jgi:hypothetical protein
MTNYTEQTAKAIQQIFETLYVSINVNSFLQAHFNIYLATTY